MSCDRKCIYCVNFIFKLMLNGYNGVCGKDGKMVRLTDACGDFRPRIIDTTAREIEEGDKIRGLRASANCVDDFPFLEEEE